MGDAATKDTSNSKTGFFSYYREPQPLQVTDTNLPVKQEQVEYMAQSHCSISMRVVRTRLEHVPVK